jgi:hypothetical protein
MCGHLNIFIQATSTAQPPPTNGTNIWTMILREDTLSGDGEGYVTCPIWTPNDGPSKPSKAQHRAMANLGCLLRSASDENQT